MADRRLNIQVHYNPRHQFKPFHVRTQRFSCIVAHRRCGKTVACVSDLLLRALRNHDRQPRYAYIAPLYKQAKDVAWPYFKSFVQGFGEHCKVNESELRVELPNGASCRLYGADNPDSLRGIYLDGCVLDEYAQIDPRLWPEIIRPALADREGWANFIGTPAGRDAFYAIWREALKNPDTWYTAMLKASETKIVPQDELDEARKHMSESQYNREWLCSFDEPDVDQFLSGVDIAAAIERSSIEFGPRLIGVDPARFGDDRTVIAWRNGDRVPKIDTYRGLDLMETVGRVTMAIEQFKPELVFVDGVGIGAGVVDRLRQLQYSNIIDVNGGHKARNEKRYYNKRAEMWGLMKDWIMDKGDLPDIPELVDDLAALTYSFDHANRIKLEKKEDLKKRGLPSPDLADALALTWAQQIAPKEVRNVIVDWKAEPEDDPFAVL